MLYYTYGNYMCFNNNVERPKSCHKVFILNQESDFYITSPLKIMVEKWYHLQNCLLKTFLNRVLSIIYKLFLSYQKFVYATKIVKKGRNLYWKKG